MTTPERLEMAKEIYIRRASSYAGWDLQKLARESLNMAMQFSLAVQAEQAEDSSSKAGPARLDLPPTNPPWTGSPGTSSSAPPPLPGSTTNSAALSATETTAGAGSGSGTAPPAHTGSSQQQSQEQSRRAIQQAPFAPPNPT